MWGLIAWQVRDVGDGVVSVACSILLGLSSNQAHDAADQVANDELLWSCQNKCLADIVDALEKVVDRGPLCL